MGKKFMALLCALTLVVTTLLSSTMTGVIMKNPEDEVFASEELETMSIPIVVYDHLNDGFLFEYDLSNAYMLSMCEGFGDETGTGLVESELGEDGTPVYTKDTVEAVAEYMAEYINGEYTVDNDLHNEIIDLVTSAGDEYYVTGDSTHYINLEQSGWTMSLADSYSGDTRDSDEWYDTDGDIIWYQSGDALTTDIGGSDNIATYDFGTLEAGTYIFYVWGYSNVNINLTGSGVDVTVTSTGNTEITLTEDSSLILTVTPESDGTAYITHPSLLEEDGETYVIDNFTLWQTMTAEDEGWILPEGSSWAQSSWGGITCDDDEDEAAYYYVDVEEGREYAIIAETNDSSLCVAELEYYDGSDWISLGSVEQSFNDAEPFTVESGVDQVRIAVLPTGDSSSATRRFDNINVHLYRSAEVGDYDETYNAYSVEHTKNSLADAETCMDYVYYVTNNFWSDTNNDITQKTNLYDTLTLNLDDDGKYKFQNGKEIVYDIENQNIYNTDDSSSLGFFPLDSETLGDASDLTDPFGIADGEIEDMTGTSRNFHFAMKAHCEFVYDEDAEYTFNFSGDDDVYVFIDGKLAMDLGGAHAVENGTIDLNEIADEFGMVDGETYSFDFFYMERHSTASNILIETNMVLLPGDATSAITCTLDDGTEVEDGSTVQAGETVNVAWSVTAGNDDMSNITFNDSWFGAYIGADGFDLGTLEVEDGLTATVYDEDGNVVDSMYISVEDLEDDEKLQEFLDFVASAGNPKEDDDDTSYGLAEGYTLEISGMSYTMPVDTVVTSTLTVDITSKQVRYGDNGTVEYYDDPISVVTVTLSTIPTNTVDAAVSVSMTDTDGDDMNGKTVYEETEVNIAYTITVNSAEAVLTALTDDGTGFNIDSDGITIPSGYSISDGLIVTIVRSGVTSTYIVTTEDIEGNTENYTNMISALFDETYNDGDTVTISGLTTKLGSDNTVINSDVTAYVEGDVPTYDEETGEVTVNTVSVTSSAEAEVEYVEIETTTTEEVTTTTAEETTTTEEVTTTVEETTTTEEVTTTVEETTTTGEPTTTAEETTTTEEVTTTAEETTTTEEEEEQATEAETLASQDETTQAYMTEETQETVTEETTTEAEDSSESVTNSSGTKSDSSEDEDEADEEEDETDEEEETETSVSESSSVSPKTGYDMSCLTFRLFMLMLTLAAGITAFSKTKRNR